jgi:hypothetical protein
MRDYDKIRKYFSAKERVRLGKDSDDFMTPPYLHETLNEEGRKEQLWKELYD